MDGRLDEEERSCGQKIRVRTWVQQESTTKQNLYALNFNKKIGWAVGGDGIVLRYESKSEASPSNVSC